MKTAPSEWDATINGMSCFHCYYQPENDAAAEKCKAMGLATMSGTDRQENWAKHIRLRVASEIDTEIEAAVTNFRAACHVARASALQTSHAGYWIALKDEPGAAFVPAWVSDWARKNTTEEWPYVSE